MKIELEVEEVVLLQTKLEQDIVYLNFSYDHQKKYGDISNSSRINFKTNTAKKWLEENNIEYKLINLRDK